jgi:hypothetical protein
MIIKKDPAKQAKADIADILRNHEWLYLRESGDHTPDWIDYEMLSDLVYDLVKGKTFGRGAIN